MKELKKKIDALLQNPYLCSDVRIEIQELLLQILELDDRQTDEIIDYIMDTEIPLTPGRGTL